MYEVVLCLGVAALGFGLISASIAVLALSKRVERLERVPHDSRPVCAKDYPAPDGGVILYYCDKVGDQHDQ